MRYAQKSLEGLHTVDDALKIIGTYCQNMSQYLSTIRPRILVGLKHAKDRMDHGDVTPAEVLCAEEDFCWNKFEDYILSFTEKEPSSITSQVGKIIVNIGDAENPHIGTISFTTSIRNGKNVIINTEVTRYIH